MLRCLALLLAAALLPSALCRLSGSASSQNSHQPQSDRAIKTLSSQQEDIDDEIYRTDDTGCPVPFLRQCRCHMASHNGREKYVVNCTNTSFKDANCLSALPDNTEVLIFTGNFVEKLPPNTLGTESEFDSLEWIDLTNNGIKEIDGQAFHRVGNVKTLILNHNNLSIVEKQKYPRVFSNFVSLESLHLTNAFTEDVDSNWYLLSLETIFKKSMLTRLKKLHLEQNEIWNFRDPHTFCDLPALQDLYLANNRLAVIEFDLFCLKHLRHLDLEYNSIQRLDSNETAILDKLSDRNPEFSVRLTGNPFICDCNIEHFYNWLLKTDTIVKGHGEYRCFEGTPSSNKQTPIMQLKHMECMTSVLPDTHTSTSSVVLGLLVFVLCVGLGLLIYRQRRQLLSKARAVQPQLQSAIQNVKRARQYTNIQPQEDAEEVQV